jgi:hypothetical protein
MLLLKLLYPLILLLKLSLFFNNRQQDAKTEAIFQENFELEVLEKSFDGGDIEVYFK